MGTAHSSLHHRNTSLVAAGRIPAPPPPPQSSSHHYLTKTNDLQYPRMVSQCCNQKHISKVKLQILSHKINPKVPLMGGDLLIMAIFHLEFETFDFIKIEVQLTRPKNLAV